MRRPHMSAGAWIFASVIAAAILAPVGVYAAASSTVAIGNPANGVTASVNGAHQLDTGLTAPSNVVRISTGVGNGCNNAIYTPPAGKSIDVTEITYDLGTGTQGNDSSAALLDGPCGKVYDVADTVQAYETESHTFPSGLPLSSVGILNGNAGGITVTLTGYLIPASQLPATSTPALRQGQITRSHAKG